MVRTLLVFILIAFAIPASAGEITIATFNIQVFGQTKASKPDVMATLAGIVRRYDLAAIQEIKDSQKEVPGLFLDAVNADGSTYAMDISPRTGRQDDDRSSQEQYGYYYDTATIEQLGEGALFDDSAGDLFQREPYAARFKAKAGSFTFVLIDIHTRPESAVREIRALFDVMLWAQARWPDEDDFIVLGDFNASCDYAADLVLDNMAIHGADFRWIVPHDADTNLSSRRCAYDRIVTTVDASLDFTGEWGVDRAFTDKKVSDHWPVWARFHDGRD
jgi:endonuclease/exonuclease/phosphatase family metal-dependent hydrolase